MSDTTPYPSRLLTPRQRMLGFAAIMASVFSAGITLGITVPLLALVMEREGYAPTVIGVSSSIQLAALMVASALAPLIARRIGLVPALLLGSALTMAGLMILSLIPTLLVIILARILVGIGNALDWVLSEVWVSASPVSEATRGRLIAIYGTVFSGGIAIGPLVLRAVGTQDQTAFYVALGLVLVATLPVIAARRVAPPVAGGQSPTGLLTVIAAAPLLAGFAAMEGYLEGALSALLPLQGLRQGLTEGDAVLLLTAFGVGSMVLMVPAGYLADRVNRMGLAVALVAMTALALAATVPLAGQFWPQMMVWFLIGGTIGALYTITLTMIGERFAAGDLSNANAALILCYTLGSIVGPGVGGVALDMAPETGLIWATAGMAALFLTGLAGLWAWRRGR